jgi:ADP-ribosyl-[dinitrogen reductase] hydrolase
MKRTSLSHPLQIAAVSPGQGYGRIGITFCPGKYDASAHTGAWDRDLGIDLDAVRTWGASAVVTLVEQEELILLRVPNLGEEVFRRGMSWFHLPIIDVSIPGKTFEAEWKRVGEQLRSMLSGGSNVVVHCRGGLGRAGTIVARLLVELGVAPETAIANVRRVRPGAIETHAQEQFVLGLRAISDPLSTGRTQWTGSKR